MKRAGDSYVVVHDGELVEQQGVPVLLLDDEARPVASSVGETERIDEALRPLEVRLLHLEVCGVQEPHEELCRSRATTKRTGMPSSGTALSLELMRRTSLDSVHSRQRLSTSWRRGAALAVSLIVLNAPRNRKSMQDCGDWCSAWCARGRLGPDSLRAAATRRDKNGTESFPWFSSPPFAYFFF